MAIYAISGAAPRPVFDAPVAVEAPRRAALSPSVEADAYRARVQEACTKRVESRDDRQMAELIFGLFAGALGALGGAAVGAIACAVAGIAFAGGAIALSVVLPAAAAIIGTGWYINHWYDERAKAICNGNWRGA